MKKIKKSTKQKFLKVINIICYICTCLFFFVLLLSLLGSCKNKTKIEKSTNMLTQETYQVNPNDNYYILTYDDQFSFDGREGYAYVFYDNSWKEIYSIENNTIDLFPGGSINILQDDEYLIKSNDVNFDLPSYSSVNKMVSLDRFYPYSYLGGNDNEYFVQYNSPNPNGMTLTIYKGLFISNGQYFDEIRLVYFNAYGRTFGRSTERSSNSVWDENGYLSFAYVQYLYVGEDVGVVPYQADYLTLSDGSGTTYTGSSSWTNIHYSTLTLLYQNDIPNGNNGSVFSQLDYFNLLMVKPQFDGFSSTYGYDYLNEFFNVLSISLSAWWSIFSISIFPGLTLGSFILFPFFITIILLIIKAVKN